MAEQDKGNINGKAPMRPLPKRKKMCPKGGTPKKATPPFVIAQAFHFGISKGGNTFYRMGIPKMDTKTYMIL